MDDKNTTQAQKTQDSAAVNNDAGISVKENSIGIIERAEAAAKKNEEILKRLEEANEKHEMLLANERLGGRTDAGQSMPAPKPMSNVEMANAFLKGEIPNPLR